MTATVLVIAGTDSSGGAGLAADLSALTAQGVSARIVVTSVTAQGQGGVAGSWPVPAEGIGAQLEAAGAVEAVKVGMLGSLHALETVAGWLASVTVPVVVDPVLRASAGGALLPAQARPALRELMSRATLVTPNLEELDALGGVDWLRVHTGAVLVKGGHGAGDALEDHLLGAGPPRAWRHPRQPGQHRGTGCRLSSAIAAQLALGVALPDAVDAAVRWLQDTLCATAGAVRNPRTE